MRPDHQLRPLTTEPRRRRHAETDVLPRTVTALHHRVPDRHQPRLAEPQVQALLTTILEAYAGHRPLLQVSALVTPQLLPHLQGPSRTAHRAGPVHLCEPADGVLEACARVEAGQRVFALAARFQRTRAGWRCTRFHVLAPARRLRNAA